jgi:hypothetical protein
MEERLQQMEAQIAQLTAWKQEREAQQLSYPLDDPSRLTIFEASTAVLSTSGTSSALTENRSLSGNPETIVVPKAYAGTIFQVVDGVSREIPYL